MHLAHHPDLQARRSQKSGGRVRSVWTPKAFQKYLWYKVRRCRKHCCGIETDRIHYTPSLASMSGVKGAGLQGRWVHRSVTPQPRPWAASTLKKRAAWLPDFALFVQFKKRKNVRPGVQSEVLKNEKVNGNKALKNFFGSTERSPEFLHCACLLISSV